MDKGLIERFFESKELIEHNIRNNRPGDYKSLVVTLFESMKSSEGFYPRPYDFETKDVIENLFGSYQGSLVYVIPVGYDPSKFWVTTVDYGSCSVCDTLERIFDGYNEDVTDSQLKDYMTLCLHLVQRAKPHDVFEDLDEAKEKK